MTEFLTGEDLVAVATGALGRAPEVTDWGLLESAVARMKARGYGGPAYPTLHHKAAALLHSLARNRAFVHGNKRASWWAVRLFYVLNGRDLQAGIDEAYDLVMDVAEDRVDRVDEIAQRLVVWDGPLR